jgi:hypothetical protein
MLRTLLAVVIGVVLWGGLWNGAHVGVKSVVPASFTDKGLPTGAGMLVAFLVISGLCSLIAGYSGAWIARENPMRAVWILGTVNLAIGVFVQSQYWSAYPIWYHLVLLAMVLPLHWMGGTLRVG